MSTLSTPNRIVLLHLDPRAAVTADVNHREEFVAAAGARGWLLRLAGTSGAPSGLVGEGRDLVGFTVHFGLIALIAWFG